MASLLEKQTVLAQVTGLSHEGRGIASVNGKVTFLRGGLPGEQVEFQYLKRRSQFDEGEVVNVIEPAPQRTTPVCPHFEICGGCSLQHLSPEAQIALKQTLLLEQLAHLNIQAEHILPPLTSPTVGYRYRARLGVKYVKAKNKVLVGFRETNGRYIADIDSCAILHPAVGQKIPQLKALIQNLSIYDQIPQIEVAMGETSHSLIFRHLQPFSEEDLTQLTTFATQHAFELYLQPDGLSSIHRFYPKTSSQLHYTLAGLQLYFHPTHFTQINPAINQLMVARAIALLEPTSQDRILDLFCGLGNFTLPLAKHCHQIIGVEGAENLVKQALYNAQANQIDNAQFYAADLNQDVAQQPWAQQGFDKILLDPPRTGAGPILQHIVPLRAHKILYVSCNPATLTRDSQLLIQAGYRLHTLCVMDMFPHTQHVESMALFTL
ncbi:MAG: 23S rRNA (uracil(1939)-C(5))-methyltransferase RlmD [Gammaproteobacteria bacterium]